VIVAWAVVSGATTHSTFALAEAIAAPRTTDPCGSRYRLAGSDNRGCVMCRRSVGGARRLIKGLEPVEIFLTWK
jgi:hypothetical protein